MSQQGPILFVSNGANANILSALGQLKVFPIIETGWSDALDAVSRLQPAAIIAADCDINERELELFARRLERVEPYIPMIALNPSFALPFNVIPFGLSQRDPKPLIARLNAALRVRSLHATLMRRMIDASAPTFAPSDPLQDATILLIGRGGSYPALSVALGERMGVVGALSLQAAARHLNARDLDGIVVGEGFSQRVLDAFLVVLSENARFRNLPVILAGATGITAGYDLPNLEVIHGDPSLIASNASPLIRQHAFEARIQRALKSIDAGGLLDPRTGLLTREAFDRDLTAAVTDMHEHGGGLSVVRISFSKLTPRTQFDAAQILGRMLRRMDFATLDGDDGVLIVLSGTDLRNAHMISRRLTAVLKHTMTGSRREERVEPLVSLATLMPNDSVASLLARLYDADGQRAAS